jgi:hypothetical protein
MESTEQRLMRLAPPDFDFRADTVALSNARTRITKIPNRRGTDSLVVSAGDLLAPAPDSTSKGQPAITFDGSQWLDSDLPPSSWRFMHEGPVEIVHVFVLTSLSAARVISCTGTGNNQKPGHQAFIASTGSSTFGIYNATTTVGSLTSPAARYTANKASALFGWYNQTLTGHPQAMGNADAAGNTTAAFVGFGVPAASDPFGTLRIGAYRDNTFPFVGRWLQTLIWKTPRTEYRRQLVREYLAARYGVSALVLPAEDRLILAELSPYLWARADYRSELNGKVTAVADRARPGHAFAQGTLANQPASPTARVDYNGREGIYFDGANHRFAAGLPNTAFRFMSNGAGMSLFSVCAPEPNGTSVLHGTRTYNGDSGDIGYGLGTASAPSAEAVQANLAYNANDITNGTAPGGVIVARSLATIRTIEHRYKAGVGRSLNVNRTGTTNAAPGNVGSQNPSATLSLGNRNGAQASLYYKGWWFDSLLLDRYATDAEVELWRAYVLKRYGVQ